MSVCTYGGCERERASRWRCAEHYALRRSSCSVDGCDRPHYGRGLCQPHWKRWRRTGSALPQEHAQRTCAIDGCDSPSRCWDMCTMHYQRRKKSGSTEAPSRLRDDIGYAAAHARMNREDGAANHDCPCGARAKDWAYLGGDPDERAGLHGGVWMAYSLDPAYYLAMCRSCHRAFDARQRLAAS